MKQISIQGIQFDAKSSFQRGPAKAPSLIRKALHSGSMNLFTEVGVDLKTCDWQDLGDFDIQEYFEIEKITHNHVSDGNKLLTLGGDHSITYPIIKAHRNRFPKLDILHFDAHADIYHEFEGDMYSHACPFARIMENNLANRLVQVGIRTLNAHQKEQVDRYDVEAYEMKDLGDALNLKFDNPLYISLDMDVFDPAYAPGVSHHEPGGLSTRQVLDILHQLDADVIGADIVEYNPERDFQDMTAFLAAKMMKEIIGKMVET